jgi:phosphotriesterase-related protein
MKAFGGKGYSYLLDFFVPQLRKAGTREEDIQNMLKNNPLKIFGSDVL